MRTQNDHKWLHKTQDKPEEIQSDNKDRASDYTKEKKIE